MIYKNYQIIYNIIDVILIKCVYDVSNLLNNSLIEVLINFFLININQLL